MYKNNPFTLTLILLIIMAAMVYFCEPLLTSNAFGCEVGEAESGEGSSDAGQTGGQVSDGVGVAQMDNSGREGNGGESWPLIDCSNPFWWDFLPCKVNHEQD